ncbi:DNA polymerase [Photobacterium sp. GSS17]|uniref:DNA polymerase n=1 Tax=Photobacterium sp. GSS17 TaxID=3020715 RepID=UPI002362452B|nr:DNA polymerase [Photobacterium sp. GSS17]
MYSPINLLTAAKVHPKEQNLPYWITHTVTPFPVGYDALQQVLVTKHNYTEVVQRIVAAVSQYKPLVGFDIETEDSHRHDGLNRFMNINPESLEYKKPKKLVFDLNKTVMTGFSLYLDQDQVCYYFNTGHADVENRIPKEDVLPLLEFVRDNTTLVIHNACYEIAACKASIGFDVGKNYLCTMTMAVSAYNDDEYSIPRFQMNGLGGIKALLPKMKKAFIKWKDGDDFNAEQQDLLNSILAKDSTSSWSYNGLVRESRWGYGLKEACFSWFGHKMTTFEETLNGKAHMGLLTSQEACVYGADDAYWCLRLFYILYDFMQATNPQVFNTFLNQENPMPRIFAKAWLRGVPVNNKNVARRETTERRKCVEALQELQAALRGIGPFAQDPNWRMLEKQSKWYSGKNGDSYLTYRKKIQDFTSHDFKTFSDNEILLSVSGSISEKLSKDLKLKPNKKVVNFSHYMPQRVVLHDLCDLPFIYIKGDLKTDKEARGKLRERVVELANDPQLVLKEYLRAIEKTGRQATAEEVAQLTAIAEAKSQWYQERTESILGILRALDKIASIEQRIKLYINPYLNLTDPETNRMYPLTTSMLNTRRMASRDPNTMQLSKRGESTYIRGFWLPQNEDHLIMSLDWSQVELVLVGDASGDPEFADAYGQLPYKDLHAKAAAAAIAVKVAGFTQDDFELLHDPEAARTIYLNKFGDAGQYPFTDPKTHEPIDKPYKLFRSLAKGISFGYWFSGSCFTVADLFNWSKEEIFKATDSYRNTFVVAEQWRVQTQEFAKNHGYVVLPDGHRRTRYEATPAWYVWFVNQWASHGLAAIGRFMANKIQKRALNQVVNARIQGSGATLAKRSIVKMDSMLLEEGGHFDAYFMMPIHDELVFSINHKQALEFSHTLKETMCNHPEIVRTLKLDGTCSIGRTLEPYDEKKAPYGQFELDEAVPLDGFVPAEFSAKPLPDEYRQKVIDYMMLQPVDEDMSWVVH